MESFFGRNGALNEMLGLANGIQAMKSDSALSRASGIKNTGESLYALVKTVLSLLA